MEVLGSTAKYVIHGGTWRDINYPDMGMFFTPVPVGNAPARPEFVQDALLNQFTTIPDGAGFEFFYAKISAPSSS